MGSQLPEPEPSRVSASMSSPEQLVTLGAREMGFGLVVYKGRAHHKVTDVH